MPTLVTTKYVLDHTSEFFFWRRRGCGLSASPAVVWERIWRMPCSWFLHDSCGLWNHAFVCGSKRHFQSHNFCGANLIDAPLATPSAWSAMPCPQEQRNLQWIHFQLPARVQSHKISQANLTWLQYVAFVIIRSVYTKRCKRRNTMEMFENIVLLAQKSSEKTKKMPMHTQLCQTKQQPQLAWTQLLENKEALAKSSWSWHVPSCFSKARPLIVKEKQQTVTGHIYGATPWPTRRQSFSGADTGALAGAHTGHVSKIRGRCPTN